MKIRILKSDSLSLLKDKHCIQICLNKYKNYPTNAWISDVCDSSPFIDTKYDNVSDINFDMSAPQGKESSTEFSNVQSVYSALSFLTDSEASEERLWAGLCLDIGYQYVQYRWKLETVNSVAQHVFFDMGSRRSYTRNAMARLWWIGRLTYDKDNKADPYELTKFVCTHSDFTLHFLERNTSNSLHILRPFLKAIINAQALGYDINTSDAGDLSKYLNLLGGIYILDFMPEDWIQDKVETRIEQIVNRCVLSEEEIVDEESKKIINAKSRVVLQEGKTGKKYVVLATKNKFRTEPKSLVGLQKGDKVKIGKLTYHIIDIK